MLDFFSIFTRGGIVLWCFQQSPEVRSTSTIAHFIDQGLLPGKAQVKQHWDAEFNAFIEFAVDNEFDLVYVVSYQKVLQLSYIDKFLDEIQLRFRDMFRSQLGTNDFQYNYERFADVFHDTYRSHERTALENRHINRKQRSWEESRKSKKTLASMIVPSQEPSTSSILLAPLAKVMSLAQNAVDVSNGTATKASSIGPVNSKKKKRNVASKRVKKATVWADSAPVESESLDYTNIEKIPTSVCPSHPAPPNINNRGVDPPELHSTEEDGTGKHTLKNLKYEPNSTSTGFLSRFSNLISINRSLTEADLIPVIQKLQEQMMNKNVAVNVCERLCQSLLLQLNGRTIGTFDGIANTVRSVFKEIVGQLLCGGQSSDTAESTKILRDIQTKRLKLIKNVAHPYVIVFCGVNGVGKSTSLSKIAYWLLANGVSVLIAACDTFRSGAVEQLRTHTKHLDDLFNARKCEKGVKIELFDKGYGKDAANVCQQAVGQAKLNRFDVVLVDTAGRMQNNEPLMRALAKLISVNNPDLILFVGEALVGNEAVDQVVKFNQVLVDFCPPSQIPRLIDGIVLTKFDTVDDKIGAAISMAFTTSKPIVFVGTGQTYPDLKNLSVDTVVDVLLQ